MTFQGSVPVTAEGFHDREAALARLDDVADRLLAGTPAWLAIMGARKVGKTSLLLEFARRRRDGPVVVVLDVQETAPVSEEILRMLAARVIDALLSAEVGTSLEPLVFRPVEWRGALGGCATLSRLDPAIRTQVLELPALRGPELLHAALDLPERLAIATDTHVLVAIDEFQELAALGSRRKDPFAVIRSHWQRHRRVGYVVSGSARATLTEMLTSERSPFFQHFSLFELAPFDERDSVELLVRMAPPDRRITTDVARRVYSLVGGHPFYLQVVGDSLVSRSPPYDEGAVKEALQDAIFSRMGRLSLFFEVEHGRIVGRATTLAATLEALSSGPLGLAEVAVRLRAATGATHGYLARLGDAVVRLEDGRYALADPIFARWLAWRAPGGTVVPMRMVGDEAEIAAAEHLARLGFDLVYQSRGSRGAFDLLATRGPHTLAVQVKRADLPLRFPRTAWSRMVADGERFGWRWAVAAVATDGHVSLLDPTRARRGAEVRLGPASVIENVPAWIDVGRTRR